MTFLCCILTRVGGTFYSFQWDTLLLETGAIACVAAMHHGRLLDCARICRAALGLGHCVFLLFKLMYMSGVVKIQANCPTWIHLTALEYHFATQCLPGPLAWYAHQLHSFILRLSMAATLWIEIPGSVLLLSPATAIRSGAVLQILLQLFIFATGNYNFFNLLTIALCLTCLEDNATIKEPSKRTVRQGIVVVVSIACRGTYTLTLYSLCGRFIACLLLTWFLRLMDVTS